MLKVYGSMAPKAEKKPVSLKKPAAEKSLVAEKKAVKAEKKLPKEGGTDKKGKSIKSYKIYLFKVLKQSVIDKERRRDYLGKTVQVILHIADANQDWIIRVAKIPVDGKKGPVDVCVIELGGTVGGWFACQCGAPNYYCCIMQGTQNQWNQTGIGSDHIDLNAATIAGLTVAEVTGNNVVLVVEDEIMHILILMHNFLPGYKQIVGGDWNVATISYKSYDLERKTIGDVGAGQIGKELLEHLK
ncbi:hypothetical protein KI387_032270, partial [Taxus chinensis]